MTIFSFIAGPGIAAALLAGRKTQARVCLGNMLAHCAPGDRIQVREACIGVRLRGGRECSTALANAEYVAFPDGWRRWPDGRGRPGPRPSGRAYKWIGAVHMPPWASRMTLIVERVRIEPLQAITPGDVRAEGAIPILGGLSWRWPKPIPGFHRNARRAFAAQWNLTHGETGERWEDNPRVAVLGFRVERR